MHENDVCLKFIVVNWKYELEVWIQLILELWRSAQSGFWMWADLALGVAVIIFAGKDNTMICSFYRRVKFPKHVMTVVKMVLEMHFIK